MLRPTATPLWFPVPTCRGALGLACFPHGSALRLKVGFLLVPGPPQQASVAGGCGGLLNLVKDAEHG